MGIDGVIFRVIDLEDQGDWEEAICKIPFNTYSKNRKKLVFNMIDRELER